LRSTLVSRHNWPRLESSILCINGAFRSQESAYCLLHSAYCFLLTAYCSTPTRCMRPQPFTSASGRWPQTVVYTRLLSVSSIK
jgi:hypothetical protein